MKRTKPIDPRVADRQSRAILAANKLDEVEDAHSTLCIDVMHSPFADSLPSSSYDALVAYIGFSEGRSKALDNLPHYELAQFRSLYRNLHEQGREVRRLRNLAKEVA